MAEATNRIVPNEHYDRYVEKATAEVHEAEKALIELVEQTSQRILSYKTIDELVTAFQSIRSGHYDDFLRHIRIHDYSYPRYWAYGLAIGKHINEIGESKPGAIEIVSELAERVTNSSMSQQEIDILHGCYLGLTGELPNTLRTREQLLYRHYLMPAYLIFLQELKLKEPPITLEELAGKIKEHLSELTE